MIEQFNKVTAGYYQEFNGIKYTYVEKGKAEGTMEIMPHHLNPNGTIHGGALVALADSIAMAGMIYAYDFVPAATTNLSISFLRTAKSGEVKALAKILSKGRNVSAWQVDCYDEGSNLLSTMQVNFVLIKESSTEWEKKFK
ncbi:MAG: PaaI family thioesterase [Syntrophomonadaceae bacterium]|nr:PaaI family thioesterase [Syntrophomonadaceae bacterium]